MTYDAARLTELDAKARESQLYEIDLYVNTHLRAHLHHGLLIDPGNAALFTSDEELQEWESLCMEWFMEVIRATVRTIS